MLRYFHFTIAFLIVAVPAAILFAAIDKFTAKLPKKKRKYVKIGAYAVVYFIMAILAEYVVSEFLS